MGIAEDVTQGEGGKKGQSGASAGLAHCCVAWMTMISARVGGLVGRKR